MKGHNNNFIRCKRELLIRLRLKENKKGRFVHLSQPFKIIIIHSVVHVITETIKGLRKTVYNFHYLQKGKRGSRYLKINQYKFSIKKQQIKQS